MSGPEIERLRKALAMSREQFAELLGISSMTVYRWERGKTAVTGPARRLLARMAATDASNTTVAA